MVPRGLEISGMKKYDVSAFQRTFERPHTLFRSKVTVLWSSKTPLLVSFLRVYHMIISFCNTFLQNFPRVMRHIKTKQFKEKIKNCQNHEGSCIYGYIFWYPKKLLLLSIEKRHQFWTLLESGIGGLNLGWIIL